LFVRGTTPSLTAQTSLFSNAIFGLIRYVYILSWLKNAIWKFVYLKCKKYYFFFRIDNKYLT